MTCLLNQATDVERTIQRLDEYRGLALVYGSAALEQALYEAIDALQTAAEEYENL